MSRDIPFFEMFAELQLSGELRLTLAGAVLTGACMRSGGPVPVAAPASEAPLSRRTGGAAAGTPGGYGLVQTWRSTQLPVEAPAASGDRPHRPPAAASKPAGIGRQARC